MSQTNCRCPNCQRDLVVDSGKSSSFVCQNCNTEFVLTSPAKPAYPSGCQAIIAITVLLFLVLYVGSNISSCIAPKQPQSPAVVAQQKAERASYHDGRMAGQAFARSNYLAGARIRKEPAAIRLIAKSQRKFDEEFISGFEKGYNQEWDRISK